MFDDRDDRQERSGCGRSRWPGELTLVTIKPPLDACTGAFSNGGYLRCTYPPGAAMRLAQGPYPRSRGATNAATREGAFQGRPLGWGSAPFFLWAYRPPDGLRGT